LITREELPRKRSKLPEFVRIGIYDFDRLTKDLWASMFKRWLLIRTVHNYGKVLIAGVLEASAENTVKDGYKVHSFHPASVLTQQAWESQYDDDLALHIKQQQLATAAVNEGATRAGRLGTKEYKHPGPRKYSFSSAAQGRRAKTNVGLVRQPRSNGKFR
jgi:hypothetical protein